MYRIMMAQTKKDNYGSLYKFMVSTTDGNAEPIEFESKEALDKKVEDMLNNKGYAKDDFIVVEQLDYDVDAKIYEEAASGTDSDTVSTEDATA